ncbi:D-Ala-D-Ala carboxypeptidase family metallohydrolase [Tropicimonas sp. S265A]|uniref:D-Ala-D-Ala carboxypeptidase family metallohydrolase n=1 Tax=Tropicimonas sp. S265A TaxID=3415134 RepID=UPI003C79D3FE
MAKLTVEQLMAKMADPSVEDTEIAEYFILDEDASGAFAPRLKINPATVQVPRGKDAAQRTAAAMNSANWLARMRRSARFRKALENGYDGPVIVSEGDSWFQYPLLLKDTIDHLLDDYAIFSLGAAGDLLKRMADKAEYLEALRETGAEILLLSGGGNDLVAGGALASHLEEFDPYLSAEDYLLPSFHGLLDDALKHYARICRSVHNSFPHVSILCHGYDYPVPNNDRWLGKPMASRGIRDRSLQKSIAVAMMDHFNRRLRRLAKSMPHVTYIDCRGVVGDGRWHDGLHPTNAGYGDVADKFAQEIRTIANEPRSGPPLVIGGPFGSAATLSRALAAPPVIAGGRSKALSLHVGLNTVDPAHYDGWDGRLAACEADAVAMEALAASEGFRTTRLLTEAATRDAVVAEIKKAADELNGGDFFLLTVSGHGGRIPDFNQDEDHDGDEKMDETLCLFDFQLADDELYMLWSEFRAGVRVLMVPDTCHSGSMVKFGPTAPATLFGQPMNVGPSVRAMPLHVEDRVWRANEAIYRQTSKSFSALKESVLMNPLSTPIKASILNLGACMDTQFAMDGPQHGAFTGALLKVWDDGRFKGDYRDFRTAIDAQIGSPSQTPQLFERLLRDPMFVTDRPFTVQPEGRTHTSASGPTRPSASPTAATPEEEGDEDDQPNEAQVEALFALKERGTALRDATAAMTWPDYADFDAFITSLGLKHFDTDEFLILGGAHNTSGGACFGKNTYPPRALWSNIAATARVLDHLRDRLGKSIVITNAYRSPAYNACIPKSSKKSLHMKFSALDFRVSGMAAPDVAEVLRWLRDKEGLFKGGIGRYNSFTHVDTRDHNATWPPEFRDSPLPKEPPLLQAGPRDMAERLALLQAVELAAPRSRRSTPQDLSVFAGGVTRSARSFDPSSDLAARQQDLSAAVNASSVISFVENLTPGQKEDVLLSTLFAQRAADAKAHPITERAAWYEIYMQTMSLLGWVREAAPFTASQKMTGNGRFDKVILSTLAQIATGNQFEILRSAIEALSGLADDDGKIELFDFETSHTTGGNFQIGSAEASGDVINIALGAFNYTHTDKKKNILFVSWGTNELDYWLSAQKLSLSPSVYAAVRELVQTKLADSRKSLIADIDLG